MPHSISTSKTAVFEFDISELRQILTEKAAEIVGRAEPGFERTVAMEPLFTVMHGQATLNAVRVTMEDSKSSAARVRGSAPHADQKRSVDRSDLILSVVGAGSGQAREC